MLRLSHTQRGFTLIELLVVILIVGLAVGMVSMNVGSGTDVMQLRNEARDYANNYALVIEESILSGDSWGVDFFQKIDENGITRYGYRWLYLDKELGWLPRAPMELETAQLFSSGLIVKLFINKQDVDIEPEVFFDSSASDASKKDNEIRPDIFIVSSGESTPFKLNLKTDEENEDETLSLWVKGDLLGRVELTQTDEEEF